MLTATEAKLKSYQKKNYFNIVEKKIEDAVNNGELWCTINMNEIPNGTFGMLLEISNLLNELGYQTKVNYDTVDVYWTVMGEFNIYGEDIDDEWFEC